MLQPFHTFTEYYGALQVIKTLQQRETFGLLSPHDKLELFKLVRRLSITPKHLKAQPNETTN